MANTSKTSKNKPQRWVVVADGSRARYFIIESERTLTEIEDMVSPEHRLHEGDLTSDRAGRSFDSKGEGRHAMEPPHTRKQKGVAKFAHRLADRLERARAAGEIDRLVLIAPPKFLGELRSSLSDATNQLVVISIDKETTTESPRELADHLPRFF